MDLSLAEREDIAGRDDRFGDIAEISLYELPACIAVAYGWASQEEFWDNRQLFLSDNMKTNLEEWKHAFMTADEAGDICMEEYLADILLDFRNVWNCRYAEEELIKEFMGHKDDARFQKALLVFRKLLNAYLEYFPELTAGQVKEWVAPKYSRPRDRIKLSGYASLLTNRVRRFDLLGF